jgi:hypothetical protein
MRKPSKATLKREADKVWSEAVKVIAGHKCEMCGKTENLNSHHVFGRRALSTRWKLENGVCLCAGHHIQIAHQKPVEFAMWIVGKRGEDWYDALKKSHYEICKNVDLAHIIYGLKQFIIRGEK